MSASMLLDISGWMLFTAFILYLAATFFFGATIRDKRSKYKKGIAGKIGITITIFGFIAQPTYFITRWMATGHDPVRDLFEFRKLTGQSIVIAFSMYYIIHEL